MTMQQPGGHSVTKTVDLPAPGYPMVTRMISDSLFSEARQQWVQPPPGAPAGTPMHLMPPKDDPVTWTVSQAHPLIPNLKVVRMFLDRGGVEVYSVTDDGKTGMRNLVPMSRVRLVEEFMPLEVFVEEMAAAETDDDPGSEEPRDPEPALEPALAAVSNGQNPS